MNVSRGRLRLPVIALLFSSWSWASTAAADPATAPQDAERERTPPPPPRGFEGRRSLDLDDYRRKTEGAYFTGIPILNYDSNNGLGFGARLYFFDNGRVEDPLFAYAPYRQRAFLQGFATTGGLQFHWLDYDVPSIASGPFRFRAQAIFLRNTDEHYFGLGRTAMSRLRLSGSERSFEEFSEYEVERNRIDAAGQTRSRYDSYDLLRPLAIVGLERGFFSGVLRLIAGAGFTYSVIRDYTGKRVEVDTPDGDVDATMASTRLAEDCARNAIVGCEGGWDNFVRVGAALDTRDFEPDPNQGIFVDAALDVGTRVLGSEYTWVKAMISPRVYFDLLGTYADLVLALRGTFQAQSRGTPFFGMKLIPYTEDPRTGLGGLRTLRGYQQDRFVGPVMTLVNGELRWTFVRFELGEQKLAFVAVPFLDLGAVYDRIRDVRLPGWRRGQGLALRASWNLATVLTAEYGVSDEDTGVYVNFNHMF